MEQIEQIEQYIIEHLETKNPIFSNMPVCPFARKERLENKIVYRAVHIGPAGPSDDLIAAIRVFDAEPNKSTMIIYDPNQRCSLSSAYEFALQIGSSLADINILAIPLHPEDPFSVRGFRTRQTPFMMMLIQRKSLVHNAKRKLLGTAYYSKWDDYEERYMERFEEYMQELHPSVFFIRLWWKEEILPSILRGEPEPDVIIGTTVEPLSRNALHFWMHRWGKLHQWRPLCPMKETFLPKVEQALRQGDCVIATAHGGTQAGLLLAAHIEKDKLTFFPQLDPQWLTQKWPGGSYFWSFTPEEVSR